MGQDEIQRALGVIEGQLRGIQMEMGRVGMYAADTSKRVGALETKVAGLVGWAAGAGAAAALVVSLVMAAFG